MSVIRLQGKSEKQLGIYYEFDSSDKPLGEGGMGKVFRGRCVNERSGSTREVAIKFMYSDLPPTAIERSRREAEIHIRHQNLVEMLGFIDVEDAHANSLGVKNHHYHVVSELLDGVMLDNLMKGVTTNAEGRVIPLAVQLYNDYQNDRVRFAKHIIKGVLSGLQALHDEGYIHRDIDPTNIMITSNGYVKLIDFGIAKKIDALNTHDKALTVSGVFIGKPEYAAPELILGDVLSQDFSTDIYAVGILLYQCLTGHIPFEGDRADIMRRQCHEKLRVPSSIKDRELRKIIKQATEKERFKRFRSASEFRVALDRLSLQSHPEPNWRMIGVSAAVISVVAIVSLVIYNLPNSPDVKPSPVEEVLTRFAETKKQSENGDAASSFKLWQAYFFPESEAKLSSDILEIRNDKEFVIRDTANSNRTAVSYLEKAIEQAPSNYEYLYELAENYLGGTARAQGFERDIEKAKSLYQQALEFAQKKNDETYVEKISMRLDKIQQ